METDYSNMFSIGLFSLHPKLVDFVECQMSILHQVVVWTRFYPWFQSFQTWSRMPVRRLAGSRDFGERPSFFFWKRLGHIFFEWQKSKRMVSKSRIRTWRYFHVILSDFNQNEPPTRNFPARWSLGYVSKIQENILEYVTQHLHWNQNPLHLLIYVAAFF